MSPGASYEAVLSACLQSVLPLTSSVSRANIFGVYCFVSHVSVLTMERVLIARR